MSASPDSSTPDGVAAHLHAIKHRGEQEYPKQVWYIVLSAIAVATAINIVTKFWAWSQLRGKPGNWSSRVATPSGLTKGFSPRRIPAAMLTGSRILAFRWRILMGKTYSMSVLEAFITLAYLAALLIHEFVHTNNLDPDFWSNRAAHIAAAQIPLLPALSSKNNIIGWMTGVGHEKLNVLHRAAARCILVLIWVHLWGRWKMGFVGEDDLSVYHWQQLGLVAGTTYTLTVILSIRPIRAVAYEFFYFAHVILVFVFILTSYLHASQPGFGYYIWPTWVVWGFERTFRALRYIIINFVSTSKRSTGTLELHTPDSVVLTVRAHIPWGWKPGQHVFLAIPAISGFPFESHPFTIASIPGEACTAATEELVFVIQRRNGFTKELLAHAREEQNTGAQISVFVDGPYGHPPDLSPYNTCILIAGGSGVSYTLPLLSDLVRRVQRGKAVSCKVVFVWAIRDKAQLKWVSKQLMTLASTTSLSIDVLIYVTRTARPLSITLPSDKSIGLSLSDKSPTEKAIDYVPCTVPPLAASEDHGTSEDAEKDIQESEMRGLTIRQGRPDIQALLEEHVSLAEGPVTIHVSGPVKLISSVRSCLASPFAHSASVLRGAPAVHFHAEGYTM